MVCLESAGALSHISLRHKADVFRRVFMFGAVSWRQADGSANCKLLEDPFPKRLVFGTPGAGNFKAFLSTAGGYGTVGVQKGNPFVKVKKRTIEVKNINVAQRSWQTVTPES